MRIFRSRSEKIAAVATVAIVALLALGLVLLRDGDDGETGDEAISEPATTFDGAAASESTLPSSTTSGGQPVTTMGGAPWPLAVQ